jgi:2-oxoglutarate ferredoxin oxidoreductase subunit gamma
LAADASTHLLQSGAIVITDSTRVKSPPVGDFSVYPLPLTETALKLGSPRIANIIALGVLVTLIEICEPSSLEEAVRKNAPKAFLDLNIEALKTGQKMAA